MLTDAPPAGHRRHQLARAAARLEPAVGRLLDLGAGSGWLARAWPGEAIALDVFAPEQTTVPWVVASTSALPLADAAFDRVALFASLGAFAEDRELRRALGEVARVLRPGGRVVALASARRATTDALAPHRVRSGWRWRSFRPGELEAELAGVGLRVLTSDRYGGTRTLGVDWLATTAVPLLRRLGAPGAADRVGEWDAADFAAPRPDGRYLYVVAEQPDE